MHEYNILSHILQTAEVPEQIEISWDPREDPDGGWMKYVPTIVGLTPERGPRILSTKMFELPCEAVGYGSRLIARYFRRYINPVKGGLGKCTKHGKE